MRVFDLRIVAAAIAVLLPLTARAEAAQDFSGEWIVANKAQSAPSGTSSAADPGSHRGGHAGGTGGSGGMGGGGRGMSGSGRGMGSGHHRSEASGETSSRGAGATASAGDPRGAAQALTIRQSEVVFDVAADGGKRMVYRFDNRNNYGPAYGGTVTLTWSAPDLVIETHPDAGGSVEERYTLSEDGKRLTQHVHEQRAGSESARDFTREFVRSQAESSQTLP